MVTRSASNRYKQTARTRAVRETSKPIRTRASYVERAKALKERKRSVGASDTRKGTSSNTRVLTRPTRAVRHAQNALIRKDETKKKGPSPLPKDSLYPMRINKYLALKGHATRRDADTLIEKKMVLINDRVAHIGDRVQESDTVTLKRRDKVATYTYLAYNKKAGVDTHEADSDDTIFDTLPLSLKKLHLFPVGRLDKASSGLTLLTNDGRITDRLLNPDHAHKKTYDVTTKQPLRSNFKEKMEAGVTIEGYTTKPAQVTTLADNRFRITLTEGKSHQIRRMVVALYNEVQGLKRISIMNIDLGNLAPGSYRAIEGSELSNFLKTLGLG